MQDAGAVPKPAVYRFTVGLGFALAIGMMIIAFLGSRDEGVPNALAPFAIGILCAQPAAMAAHGYVGRRRGALAAAAGMSFPLILLSFSAIGLVFVVPAVMYIALKKEWNGPEPRVAGPILGALGFIVTVVTFLLLITNPDPACRVFRGGSACTSDTVSVVELVLIAAAAVFGHWLCWRLAAPQEDS